MGFKNKNSIRITAVMFIITLLMLAFFAMYMVSSTSISRYIERQQYASADTLARSVAIASVLPLVNSDVKEIQRALDSFLLDKNVLFLAVYNLDHRVVAYAVNDSQAWTIFNKSMQGDWLVGESAIRIRHQPDDEDRVEPDSRLMAFDEDPHHRILGWVEIGLSSQPMRLAQKNQIIVLIGVFLVSVSLAGIMVLLVVTAWVRRLRRLIAASWRISHGNLTHPVSDNGKDEIAMLCEAFESMRKSLFRRERELSQLNETLKLQVRERTLEVEMEKDKAEATSRIKSEYMVALSHEFKPRLETLVNSAENLRQHADHKIADPASAILHNSEQLSGLIQSMLDIVRLEHGRSFLDKHLFDLYGLLEGVITPFLAKARAKSLLLWVEYGDQVPRMVRGDEQRLRQVLSQLLDGALRSTLAGEVTLHVSAQKAGGEQWQYIFALEDTGSALSQEEIASMQQPTETSSSADQSPEGHRGITLSKHLVEVMNGRLTASNHASGGVSVTMELPLSAPGAESATQEISMYKEMLLGKKVVLVSGERQQIIEEACKEMNIAFTVIPSPDQLQEEMHKPGLPRDAAIILESLSDIENNYTALLKWLSDQDREFMPIIIFSTTATGGGDTVHAPAGGRECITNIQLLRLLSENLA